MDETEPEPAEWPSHFPPGCPPADALEANGVYLRFVATIPPTPADFVSFLELGRRTEVSDVVRAGLSVYGTKAQMEKKRGRSPLLRASSIAQAHLKPEHGKVSPAGSRGHRTLWLRRWALTRAPNLFHEEAP